MTNREFYLAISTADVTDEIKQFALSAIEKLDARNASRSEKPSKTQLENAPIKEAIVKHLTECGSALTEADLGVAIGVSHNKAGSLARQLVAEGKLSVGEVKLPKVGKRKVYSVVVAD
jgi:hypothetical protein